MACRFCGRRRDINPPSPGSVIVPSQYVNRFPSVVRMIHMAPDAVTFHINDLDAALTLAPAAATAQSVPPPSPGPLVSSSAAATAAANVGVPVPSPGEDLLMRVTQFLRLLPSASM